MKERQEREGETGRKGNVFFIFSFFTGIDPLIINNFPSLFGNFVNHKIFVKCIFLKSTFNYRFSHRRMKYFHLSACGLCA